MKRTGSEIIVQLLEKKGIEIVAGIPGSAILPLYHTLYDSSIRHILVRHEQAAGFLAQGMARSTGKAAVCLTTSGPGITNLLTAIADAKLDSVPLVAITGQVPTHLIGTDAFQEMNTESLTRSITKGCFKIQQASDLLEVLPRAFWLAESGRPGPVVIDVPKDVQTQTCEFDAWPVFEGKNAFGQLREENLYQLAEVINESFRPLLLIGAGIAESNAEKALLQFSEKNGIPVVSTLRGLGSFPPSHPNYLGMVGMHGNKAANELTEYADLILAMGVRFGDRSTGKTNEFCQNAKIIHVDIDPFELNKIKPTDYQIHADLNDFLEHITPLVMADDRTCWKETVVSRLEQIPKSVIPKDNFFHPHNLIETIAGLTPKNAIVTTDVGQHQMWVAMRYPFSQSRSFLTSGGLGTMGFGLPAAIGAALANPDRKILCFSGDGSILMNLQELATLAELRCNICILLFNNQGLGLVRQQQRLFFEEKYAASNYLSQTDFTGIARSFGLMAVDMALSGNPLETLEQAIASTDPVLINIPIESELNVMPMVPPGAANRNMLDENQ
jgi:acetolactate synthase I/II/III large subunit